MSQKMPQNISIHNNIHQVPTRHIPYLQCWQNALQQAHDLLPADLDSHNTKQLQQLPIFALVVVAQSDSLQADTQALGMHIKAWAEANPAWRVIKVQDVQDAEEQADKSKSLPIIHDRLTDVQVYRYVLLPTNPTSMSPEKKNAAAHILDEQLTAHLHQFITELPITEGMGGDDVIDCHILPFAHMMRSHRLACFDMDSTLIEQEVIVELAKYAGIGEQVNAITESAMRGEIDFDESFSQRLALLEGISTEVLDKIFADLVLSSGARMLIAVLKSLGYHTVLVSGGFVYFAERLAKELGIDEVYANILDIEEGVVTGRVQPPIINGDKKAAIVQKVAKHLNIDSSQVVCVGDGANDLPMMAQADLGIAYHAKPIVRAKADAAINATGLEGVLYALGYDTSVLTILS